jgi:hypothetical protein
MSIAMNNGRPVPGSSAPIVPGTSAPPIVPGSSAPPIVPGTSAEKTEEPIVPGTLAPPTKYIDVNDASKFEDKVYTFFGKLYGKNKESEFNTTSNEKLNYILGKITRNEVLGFLTRLRKSKGNKMSAEEKKIHDALYGLLIVNNGPDWKTSEYHEPSLTPPPGTGTDSRSMSGATGPVNSDERLGDGDAFYGGFNIEGKTGEQLLVELLRLNYSGISSNIRYESYTNSQLLEAAQKLINKLIDKNKTTMPKNYLKLLTKLLDYIKSADIDDEISNVIECVEIQSTDTSTDPDYKFENNFSRQSITYLLNNIAKVRFAPNKGNLIIEDDTKKKYGPVYCDSQFVGCVDTVKKDVKNIYKFQTAFQAFGDTPVDFFGMLISSQKKPTSYSPATPSTPSASTLGRVASTLGQGLSTLEMPKWRSKPKSPLSASPSTPPSSPTKVSIVEDSSPKEKPPDVVNIPVVSDGVSPESVKLESSPSPSSLATNNTNESTNAQSADSDAKKSLYQRVRSWGSSFSGNTKKNKDQVNNPLGETQSNTDEISSPLAHRAGSHHKKTRKNIRHKSKNHS